MACSPETYDAQVAVEVADACMPILSKIGLTITDCLACGMEGCVYLLDSGDIAKVMSRKSEPEFAAYLLTLKNVSPHMPKIRGVWQLPISCSAGVNRNLLGRDFEDIPWFKEEYDVEDGSPIFYLVVREDLEDAAGTLDPAVDNLSGKLRLALQDYIDPDARAQRDPASQRQAKREFNEAVKMIGEQSSVDEDTVEQLIELYKWMASKKLYLGDLHLDNLGLRGDTIVARDLGFSTTGTPDRLYRVVRHTE